MKTFVFLFSTIAMAVVLRVIIEVFQEEAEERAAGVYLRVFSGLAVLAVYITLVWSLLRG